ncbi:hypothetical protein CAEBREN_18566 [Caenorhabditis brenneri]|uniref:G-protein coupled receptors family 1 profile domain-containing protein n=1 Tax=Caenorhabditis brenneri TaxID=135651 RepID=G0M9S7_CAEBE|nr:hypothetical protein CAEBREN_18566 [Caenorhabditis brenneri]
MSENFILKAQLPIAILGVLVNIFHIFVLTRKAMRTNCINILMIGIGVCEFYDLVFLIYDDLVNMKEYCSTVYSYPLVLLDHICAALEDNLHRLCTWLAVLMASIRFLAIKNALNSKFDVLSRPVFGLKVILVAVILSSLLTSFVWSQFEIVEVLPGDKCFVDGTPRYKKVMNHRLAYRILAVTDGMLKILTTIVLPVFSILLIKELRKAEKARKRLKRDQTRNLSSKTVQTTKLVLLMTVTFMVAEGPFGIIYIINGLFKEVPGVLTFTSILVNFIGLFSALNSITHFLICLFVSSQYQKTVKEMLVIVRCRKINTGPNPAGTR